MSREWCSDIQGLSSHNWILRPVISVVYNRLWPNAIFVIHLDFISSTQFNWNLILSLIGFRCISSHLFNVWITRDPIHFYSLICDTNYSSVFLAHERWNQGIMKFTMYLDIEVEQSYGSCLEQYHLVLRSHWLKELIYNHFYRLCSIFWL